MAENEPELDPLDEDARLDSLDERLRRARTDEAIRSGEARPEGASDRLGSRVLAELVGGLFGGAVVGFALDWLLSTSPWFLMGMLFLGIANAFRNIIRISSRRP